MVVRKTVKIITETLTRYRPVLSCGHVSARPLLDRYKIKKAYPCITCSQLEKRRSKKKESYFLTDGGYK